MAQTPIVSADDDVHAGISLHDISSESPKRICDYYNIVDAKYPAQFVVFCGHLCPVLYCTLLSG